MIQEVTMYQAVCDGCGRCIGTQISRSHVINSALNHCGWQEINGKLYCPDCYEYDEETNEYKPNKR